MRKPLDLESLLVSRGDVSVRLRDDLVEVKPFSIVLDHQRVLLMHRDLHPWRGRSARHLATDDPASGGTRTVFGRSSGTEKMP